VEGQLYFPKYSRLSDLLAEMGTGWLTDINLSLNKTLQMMIIIRIKSEKESHLTYENRN
jgi:hypothetical protein